MKKSLIIGIILLLICFGLVIYKEITRNSLTNIHDITNKGLKKENVNVYLEATFVAGTITGDKENSFYVMFGDGVQYIVHMNNKIANKINRYLLDNPEKSYRIEGTTKLIPKEMEDNGRKFVKEWLDNNHTHGEEEETHHHDITVDEFYQYFGFVYLEVNNNPLIMIITVIMGIIGALLVINYVIKKVKL